MPEAFATVREAAKRVLGQRHFDVQIMGGAALHLGNIAEMKTGEGKTLVATLPSYLNALAGKGVHVVTVNDYLAKYHAEWMGRVHHFLGLTIGVILPEMRPAERREAYACDITYGTNNELGFDYLRDNMAGSIEECVQRGHNFADRRRGRLDPHRRGADAADHQRPDAGRGAVVRRVRQDRAARSIKDVDYEVDEKKRTISVLEPGITKVEDHLGIDNLYDSVNTPLISFLNNSIKAKELFRNDKEYVVMDGEVLIVDEHTGRMLAGRRYNDGLHQAIEAKEGVEVREEYQTLATVTLQNYFRLYEKLSGMTGTAMTEASEFDKIYRLGVVPIPTNKPMVRVDQPDLVYRTEEAKYDAVVDDIAERHEKGQPVLVGTVSVEKSEHLSGLLKQARRPALGPQRQASTPTRPRSSRSPATRARSPSPPTWPAEAPTSCSAARWSSSPTRSCASRASTRSARPPRSTTPRGRRWSSGSRRRSPPSTTRSRSSAASTSSAPSATSRAASTTSCAVAPAARATRASPGSTCRCRTS